MDKLRSQEYFARKLNETNVRFEEANNVSIKDITAKIKSLEAVPFIDKTQATRAELVYYRDTIKKLEESVDDLKNLIQQAIKKSIGEMQLFDLQIGAINTDQYKLINQKYNNN